METRSRLMLALAIASVSLGGCNASRGSAPALPSTADAAAPISCPDGFAPDPMGVSCLDVTPPGDCPAGTRTAFGSSTCEPAGWTGACPMGMQADPSGWGCREIMPAQPCTGATYESLGSTTCQPIGDCAAPFPPTGASYFVDASFTPAETDATHYTTIGAALANAPAGAIVAIDSGTYAESVNVTVAVSLVGRCAQQVIIQGPVQSSGGIQAAGVSGTVEISGLSVVGFVGGIVEQESTVKVDGCLLSTNTAAGVVVLGGSTTITGSRITGTTQEGSMIFGAATVESGGKLVLTDVAIVGNAVEGVAVAGPGDVEITRSIIRGTTVRSDNGEDGSGVNLIDGATAEISGSVLAGNHTHGIEVAGSGTKATISQSIVRDTGADAVVQGYGVQVDTGGSAQVDSSLVAGSGDFDLLVTGAKSKLTVTSSVVSGTNAAGVRVGMGAAANIGGALTLTGVAVVEVFDTGLGVDNAGSSATVSGSLFRDVIPFSHPSTGYAFGTGVSAGFGGVLTMTDSTVDSATTAGVSVGTTCDPNYPKDCGGTASLSKIVVLSTSPGMGGNAVGLLVEEGGQVTVESSVFAENQEVGMVVTGTGTNATVTGSIFRDTGKGTDNPYGYGWVVVSGATGSMAGSFVRDNLGVGLAFQGAQAGVDTTVVSGNEVGIFVADGTLDEVPTQPATLGQGEIAVSDCQFVDNVVNVSMMEVPVPVVSVGATPQPSP